MAQSNLPPGVPRAGEARTARAPHSASPTKSLWRRLLSRASHASPAVLTKSPPKPCPSAPTVAPPVALPVTVSSRQDVSRAVSCQPPTSPIGTAVTTATAVPAVAITAPVAAPASTSPAVTVPTTTTPASPITTPIPTINVPAASGDGTPSKPAGSSRRIHRDVVPGLPRAQTFARQQSELRENLLPVTPTSDERRATSMDRRLRPASRGTSQNTAHPRMSAPSFVRDARKSAPEFMTSEDDAPSHPVPHAPEVPSLRSETSATDLTATDHDPAAAADGDNPDHLRAHYHHRDIMRSNDGTSLIDTASMTSSQYEQTLLYELEHIWILNLSMHFRDKSRREKFFVTYRQRPDLWRRVTVSLDYRNAPDNSLEMDLLQTKFQRDKNEKIYEAIRDSLSSIQFYDTVTNLKLQTTDGRLHVHVVEDVTEIIKYPTLRMVQHLRCRMIRERDIEFDSHMSGFVYKVRVNGRMLIKKEIPGPESVDEFLYEVNALTFLSHSHNVIEFYGMIVDDNDHVTGLLISYAERGALIDIIYDNNHGIPWATRVKWARQIVQGLSEIHEAGYVQGDFTLSNIVIDHDSNAKIIDINRRGCPVGWEPPEATPLIENKQRISMYIGVKSDLYQLGMVLWALTMQDDEPEAHARPLHLPTEVEVPGWFRTIVETCLHEDPRVRVQARQLVRLFPFSDDQTDNSDSSDYYEDEWMGGTHHPTLYERDAVHRPPGDGAESLQHDAATKGSISHDADGDDEAEADEGDDADNDDDDADDGDETDHISAADTKTPSHDWSYVSRDHTYVDPVTGFSNEPYYYPTRGRSPPSSHRRKRSYDSPENTHTQYNQVDLRASLIVPEPDKQDSPTRASPERHRVLKDDPSLLGIPQPLGNNQSDGENLARTSTSVESEAEGMPVLEKFSSKSLGLDNAMQDSNAKRDLLDPVDVLGAALDKKQLEEQFTADQLGAVAVA